jgi:hypothetical protein
MKTKLKWEKKWLDDKSGYWYSAKVPVIGWEYIVDTHYNVGINYEFVGGLFFAKYDDDITRISNKFYKTEEKAMTACEKHLDDTAEKFNKWLSKK